MCTRAACIEPERAVPMMVTVGGCERFEKRGRASEAEYARTIFVYKWIFMGETMVGRCATGRVGL